MFEEKEPDNSILNKVALFEEMVLEKSFTFFDVEDFEKITAGWLIEKAVFNGLKNGKVGMHKKQALVLVNYGTSSGKLLWKHAKYVMEGVEKKFGITLETEVNLIC